MSVDLIIDSTPSEVVIAILKNKRLVELHREKSNNNFAVGDLYLGRVKKIMPGLNAAFVDVGYEKDAFLHYLDLGPQFASLSKFSKSVLSNKNSSPKLGRFKREPDINKHGKINDVLSSKQHIITQVAKEPISTKGPRLTSEISIPGRFLVLVPFNDKVSVSQKIKNKDERDRLIRLIKSIKPKGFGIIIRTVAENKKVADLHSDLSTVTERWETLYKKLKTAKPPKKILGELNRTSTLLRDLLNSSFNSIQVNDEALYNEIRAYLKSIAPDKEKIVKFYNGKLPIFDQFGVEKQIKASFGKNVTMKSGAYLVIEHTEALHVIDVNSGQRSKSSNDQEQNALEVNMEAAEEIARQLKLRDMGGIIVVDFIDQRNAKNRNILFEKMKETMKEDRAKHTILPPSKFGLIQITRQRVRPEMDIKTSEKCPCCNGSGEIQASVLLIDEIENTLKYLLQNLDNINGLTLCLHPYISAYITKGYPSLRTKWFFKYNKWVNVRPMVSYKLLQYKFVDKKDEEVKV